MRATPFIILGAFTFACLSTADTVFLKDGTKREGKVVSDSEESVLLSVGAGEMSVEVSIPKSAVQRVVIEETANERLLKEYRQRMGLMDDKGAQDWFELGLWCERQPYLARQAAQAFKMALELDPNHEGARIKHGFVRYNGEWMTEEQAVKAKLAEQRKELEALPTDQKIDLIAEAFRQSHQPLRDRAVRAEADLAAERKLRDAAERRVKDLEDRLTRLEEQVSRANTSSTVIRDRQPLIIIRNTKCCDRFPHPGFDCAGKSLPEPKPNGKQGSESRMIPATGAEN